MSKIAEIEYFEKYYQSLIDYIEDPEADYFTALAGRLQEYKPNRIAPNKQMPYKKYIALGIELHSIRQHIKNLWLFEAENNLTFVNDEQI